MFRADAYWTTPAGIKVRLADLAEDLAFRTYNNAIQVYASSAGVKEFKWLTVWDERTCDYCASMNGRTYRRGQFMPANPAHPGCRCTWDIYLEA